MKQWGKILRIVSGAILLINLGAFFIPLSQSVRENYPLKTWSGFEYLIHITDVGEPYMSVVTGGRIAFVIGLILLPVMLSVTAFVVSVAGSEKQVVSGFLAFAVFGLYVALYVCLISLFPDITYQKAVAGIIHMIASGISAWIAMMALAIKEKEVTQKQEIPAASEPVKLASKPHTVTKYSILSEGLSMEHTGFTGNVHSDMSQQQYTEESQRTESYEQFASLSNVKPDFPSGAAVVQSGNEDLNETAMLPKIPSYVEGSARGVIVGVRGLYAGAEISMKDKEPLKMGRSESNNLVFPGQTRISRSHCILTWDADKKEYRIIDSSNNGTFANGSDDCLPKNLEIVLEPGTVIGLGDEFNAFRLE